MSAAVDSLEAKKFWRAGRITTLGDFMRNVEMNRLADDAWLLSTLYSNTKQAFSASEESRLYVLNRLRGAVECFQSFDLTTSAAVLAKVLVFFENVASESRQPTQREFAEVSSLLANLSITLGVEAETKNILMLSASNALLVKNPLMFGQVVADLFPDAITDIQEAGQCMAFGRYTACVFHLMRAMENALQLVSSRLVITFKDKDGKFLSWGVLASNLRAKVDTMNVADEKQKWSEIHAMLVSVKDAWRNTTMHPKQTYTEDEAVAIFSAVKGFMNVLARSI